VASSALAFDARREMAVFLRTRVSSVRTIILPAYAANAAAAIAALVLGAGCAWYETAVLIGTPATGAMLAGILYGAAFLAFAVALVAGVASMVRGVLATAGTALVILLLLGIVGGLSGQSRWLPTGLLGALAELTAGAPATRFLPGLAVTLVLTAISLAAAVVLGDRREV
jgi:ABC-2 type transport system permease protein